MTIGLWLVVIVAVFLVAYRKRLAALIGWHPITWAFHIVWLGMFAVLAGIGLWLASSFGLLGAAGFTAVVFGLVIAWRIVTGSWPGEDDTLHLD